MRDHEAFAALTRSLVPEGRLERCRPLEGGVSASMHALEIAGPGHELRRVVVRRHGAADWKTLPEGVTATEFALLEALHRQDMAVPEPCLLDESCEIIPTPYFVMAWVDGTTTVPGTALPEALRQMAEFLAQLHTLDIGQAGLPVLPAREDPSQGALQYLPANALADRVRAALAGRAAGRHANPPSLLHGDFWPGNILWRQGQLAAVVDWEDAALGDPLSDLACCRVELLCQYDEAAMDAFTAHYRASMSIDYTDLPLWDVYVSAAAAATMGHWGLEPEVEARRRQRTQWFMVRAAQELLSLCSSSAAAARSID